jgi:hypothetical protein
MASDFTVESQFSQAEQLKVGPGSKKYALD